MEPITGNFFYLIKQVELGMRPLLERAVAEQELTPAQYTTLTVLQRAPGLTSSELARRSLVRAQSMSATIAVLLRRGLIFKTLDEANRRQFHLGLTERGSEVVDSVHDAVQAGEAVLLSNLSKAQRAAFHRYLRACRDAVSEDALSLSH